MRKLNHLIFTFLLFSCSQSDVLKKVFLFPNALKEVSGIEVTHKSNLIWVLQDSGNAAEIYGLDTKGNIAQTIAITNAENKDWEDLTSDTDGNLYIGDFGNNSNDRRDLSVYKLNASDLKNTSAKVSQKTSFYFPEQKEFPPKKSKRIFDVEAFFTTGNHFYLFTKNRSAKFDGTTLLYQVPNLPGNHAAKLLGTFKTCESFNNCAITSADISPDGTKVALLSSSYVWLFTNFTSNNYFSGNAQKIDLAHYSQKEGLCFKDNQTVLICDEMKKKNGGTVYELTISDLKPKP